MHAWHSDAITWKRRERLGALLESFQASFHLGFSLLAILSIFGQPVLCVDWTCYERACKRSAQASRRRRKGPLQPQGSL